jgi:hypothetical protein
VWLEPVYSYTYTLTSLHTPACTQQQGGTSCRHDPNTASTTTAMQQLLSPLCPCGVTPVHPLSSPPPSPFPQLAPQDKGYLVVAWATPSSEVAPGAWALTATSSAPLPPLVEQPPGRVLAMEGAYSSNLAGVMSRWVVTGRAAAGAVWLEVLRFGLPGA